ncbi:protein FAM160B1-like [Cimex lectularius]|uniref:FHF complex subunit HOOK-interacting protein C-terminal domain-containing protein n=1 Tax=Cimex lectularius TaxID=79782 RepID=A0A8I6TGM9_CIMLE|nr:protein FAM160B1-like [Cimex lectularius]
MLGRFSTALQNAVDVLAPPPPLHEDFAYHWKKLMKNYLDIAAEKTHSVEATNIPARFDQLLKILIKEDEEMWVVGHPGPCMEYLLQHNLLDLVVSLADSDDPPGIRKTVLQFIAKFLTNIKTPVLGHTSVYPPLQRLIAQCDGSSYGSSEMQEVHYLLGLTAMVRRNPQLLPVFTSNVINGSCGTSPDRNRRESYCSSEASCVSSTAPSDCSSSAPQNNPLFAPLATSVRSKVVRLVPVPPDSSGISTPSSDDNKSLVVDESAQFPLLDAALPYLQSQNCKVRLKACQTVMLLVSLPDSRAAEIIVADTLLLSKLTSRLNDLYHNIPSTTDPSFIDDIHVSWGLDIDNSDLLDGTNEVTTFLSWYDFCDQILAESHQIIGEALSKEIKEKFLNEIFTLDVLVQPLDIAILAKCYKMSTSKLLIQVLSEWLVGAEVVREIPGANNESSVYQTLISNWKSYKVDLITETLRFFEVILEKGDQHVLDCLALVYVNDNSFLDKAVDEIDDNSEDSLDKKSRIDRIIDSFINVLPVELRCTENNSYVQYLAETQRQYTSVLAQFNQSLKNPSMKKESDKRSSENEGWRQFYEGPFLRALFEAIANIPNQPYEVNLELTGVISRICLRPEPSLSCYLLDTCVLKLAPEVNSLCSVLTRTAAALETSFMCKPGNQILLKETRARLITEDPNLPCQIMSDSTSSTFENIVVLEELCKELAAIAFVKHRHESSHL